MSPVNEVFIQNRSGHPLPEYATIASAGLDVRAKLEDSVVLQPGEWRLIPTGLFAALPVGTELQVRPRSGLAFKHGITVLNSPGTIDADYRGEIGVILINHGNEQVFLKKGERIGQLVMNKVERIEWNPVTSLTGTKRGEHGFGSTGNK